MAEKDVKFAGSRRFWRAAEYTGQGADAAADGRQAAVEYGVTRHCLEKAGSPIGPSIL
jgi:hypothetical protein